MKKAILTAFMLLTTLFSIAQISYENKIEIELKDGYNKEQVLGIGEQGFIIHSKKNEAFDNQTTWRYELFDANLNAVMSKEVSVDKKKNSVTGFYTDEYIFSFYKNRLGGGDVTLVTMRIPSMEVVLVEEIRLKSGMVTSMGLLGDYIFLGTVNFFKTIMVGGKNANFSMINWKTGERKAIPNVVEGYSSSETLIFDIQPSWSSLQSEIMVYAKVGKKPKNMKNYLIRYDSTGKKLNEINLTTINPNIIQVSANQLPDDDRLMFSGTYGKKTQNAAAGYAAGIFIGTMKNDSIEFSKTYQFTDLENFFSHLPQKRQEKIKRKKQRNANFNKQYMMNMHPTLPWNEGYLLVGEAILKHVSTSGGYNGTAQTTTVNYEGTHVSILKIDKQGNLLWDKAFKMSEHSRQYPPKSVRVTGGENHIQLAFVLDNKKLTLKKISSEGEILQDYEAPIIEKEGGQKEIYLPDVTVNYWYDNYFIVYGKHKIKNNEKGKRKIFFISKIKYE